MAAAVQPGGLWIDVSGSSDNGDARQMSSASLHCPGLTLADLAAAAEPAFEAVEIRQGVFGATPDTDFRAWVAVFRRRDTRSDPALTAKAAQAVARG